MQFSLYSPLHEVGGCGAGLGLDNAPKRMSIVIEMVPFFVHGRRGTLLETKETQWGRPEVKWQPYNPLSAIRMPTAHPNRLEGVSYFKVMATRGTVDRNASQNPRG